MKRKLACLILAAVMLLPLAFAGCSDNDSTGADVATNTGAKTITMRMVTERKVFNTDAELEKYLTDVCGGNKNDERYIEAKTVKEAYDAVEAAFSKETKSLNNTNVDILFYTEDEYFEMLEKTMAEYALEQKEAAEAKRALKFYVDEYMSAFPEQFTEDAIKKSFYKLFPEYKKYENFSDGVVSSGDKYEIGDFGIPQLVYPEADENQLDIVYIQGESMYKQYIENEWIIGLDEYLGASGRLLTTYISTTLMNGVKVDGRTFAIPNNVIMGEYTYMLVDKELADKYPTSDTFSDIANCDRFLEDIKECEPQILPIKSNFDDCMDMLVWYWNIDYEKPNEYSYNYTVNSSNSLSLLGCVYGDPFDTGRGKIELGFNNLFADERYVEILKTLKRYEYQGMFEAENETRTGAAISFMTGTYAIKKDAFFDENGNEKKESDPSYGVYTDANGKQYYVHIVKYPKAEQSSLYGNMFAISANSKYPEACMKVLTELNTNPKLKNILQHGIEGTDYQINEDNGQLEKLREIYVMKNERTGNCFISHPDEGLPANFWEDAKGQSNETLIDPLLGFDFNARLAEYNLNLDYSQLNAVKVYSAEIEQRFDSARTYEEFLTELEAIMKTTGNDRIEVESLGQNILMTKLTDKDYNTSGGESGEPDNNGESPYTIYYKWLVDMKYLPDTVK